LRAKIKNFSGEGAQPLPIGEGTPLPTPTPSPSALRVPVPFHLRLEHCPRPREGVCGGAKFLAPPNYSQSAVFASPLSTFFHYLLCSPLIAHSSSNSDGHRAAHSIRSSYKSMKFCHVTVKFSSKLATGLLVVIF